MAIKTLLIDLDDTVYSPSTGLWTVIGARIDQYMQEKLELPEDQIQKYRIQFFKTYGTTLRGLKQIYNIDEDEYLAYVHDIPLNQYLEPNPSLRQMIIQLPYRKFIFTNADRNHAHRVMNVIGLTECFDGIIDIKDVSPYCKPLAGAYEIALQIVNESAQQCVFIDDSKRNLQGAEKVGLATVHVNENGEPGDFPTISSLIELPKMLEVLENREIFT